MYTNAITAFALLSSLTSAMPTANNNTPRQAKACFVIGNTALPAEVTTAVAAIQDKVTCSTTAKTIDNVPDVTSGTQTFSKIDFSKSKQQPLEFALAQFKTATPLAKTDLATFQDALNVYTATEAGLRSVAGPIQGVKVPKFFLAMQISRIQTAQGNPPKAAGQQVDHLRDKVLKNAAGESKAFLDQVTKLATETT
ncbi:hypothetical protein ACJQWK_00087 [Exserohilum turcicum]|uniref:DUF7143 domain-containing protein n=1 Tax=Exserohilum turcicum (strain 28A) TaxID=671987 RepID=R0IDI1_EXST2|nr:uncharacterized protein SETTUDRAFT_94313 [Exserohilum turcica Et28A]EOA83415.1 hypothetical protein SETTUDRAFT_94313 [Exserohilum turcica Et28A]